MHSVGRGRKYRQNIASQCFRLAYLPAGHPSIATIKDELCGLANLFSVSNFERARAGAPAEWFQAQVRYLKHSRKRASGPVRRVAKAKPLPAGGIPLGAAGTNDSGDSASTESSEAETSATSCTNSSSDHSKNEESDIEAEPPDATHSEAQARVAAGSRFDRVVMNQIDPVVLNGLVASYRCKLWAMLNGRQVSLGTVGKERDWRNKQRRARNKGRSRADILTVNLLTLQRYVQEVAARSADSRRREQNKKCSRPDRELDAALAAEELAAAILQGAEMQAPLALTSASSLPSLEVPDDVGYIYTLFREGHL